MYANRFFLTEVGTAFALYHVTETPDVPTPVTEESAYQIGAADGTALWAWGAALYWAYASAVDAVEEYARQTLMLSDTRVELIDLRYGVPTQVDIYANLRLQGSYEA